MPGQRIRVTGRLMPGHLVPDAFSAPKCAIRGIRGQWFPLATTDYTDCTDPSRSVTAPWRGLPSESAPLRLGNRGQTALLEDSEKAVFALSDSVVQANSEPRTSENGDRQPSSKTRRESVSMHRFEVDG